MAEQITISIDNVEALRRRVAVLEKIKEEQEIILAQNIQEVYHALKPTELLKSAIEVMKDEKESLAEAGHLSIDYLSQQYMNNTGTFSGWLKGIIAKEAIHMLYNRYEDKIHNFIGKTGNKMVQLFSSKSKKNN